MKISDEDALAAVDSVLLEAKAARERMEYLAYRLANLLPEMDNEFSRDVVYGRVLLRPIVELRSIDEFS